MPRRGVRARACDFVRPNLILVPSTQQFWRIRFTLHQRKKKRCRSVSFATRRDNPIKSKVQEKADRSATSIDVFVRCSNILICCILGVFIERYCLLSSADRAATAFTQLENCCVSISTAMLPRSFDSRTKFRWDEEKTSTHWYPRGRIRRMNHH